MRNNSITTKSNSIPSASLASVSHEKKSSEQSILKPITTTIFSFVELVDLIPSDDPRSALLRIISDRLEGDLAELRSELASH